MQCFKTYDGKNTYNLKSECSDLYPLTKSDFKSYFKSVQTTKIEPVLF